MEINSPGLTEAAEAFMQGIRSGEINAFVAIGLTGNQVEYFISLDDETDAKVVEQIIDFVGFMDILKNRMGMHINLGEPIKRGPQLVVRNKENNDD